MVSGLPESLATKPVNSHTVSLHTSHWGGCDQWRKSCLTYERAQWANIRAAVMVSFKPASTAWKVLALNSCPPHDDSLRPLMTASSQLSKGTLLGDTDSRARVPFGALASFSHRITDFLLHCQMCKCFPSGTFKRQLLFPRKPGPPK